MDAIMQTISDNKVAWMLVLFVGVLYWAFRSRFRAPKKPGPPQDGA